MATKRVLKVRADGTALISTRGLRRVVLHPSGNIAKELCPVDEAEYFAGAYNRGSGEHWAEVQTYPQVFANRRGKRMRGVAFTGI